MKKFLSVLLSLSMLLSLAPFTVAADEAEKDYGENICLGKSVYCDGVYQSNWAMWDPQKAIDGDYSTNIAPSANTSEGAVSGFKGFVAVDLGETYLINTAILQTRTDYDAAWARKDIAIYLATKADYSDAVMIGDKWEAGDFKSKLIVELKVPRAARYVIVAATNKGAGANAFAEIEAYGVSQADLSSANFEDVEGVAYNAVKLMTTLGVMEALTPTSIGADYLISRGEAAMLISKFAQVNVGTDYHGQFEDVTAEHQYAPYIQAGLDAGFISEDTHFRPDEYIKAYELVKMVLCVNGYYISAVNAGVTDYPAFILAEARRINLLDNMKNQGMDFINRSDAAIMLYNAYVSNTFGYNFEDEIYEKSEDTLLEQLYEYKFMHGIVTGNPITQIDTANSSISTGRVWIDKIEYVDEEGTGANYLGEEVYFLVDEDNAIVTLWENDKYTEKVTIYSEDIEEADLDMVKVTDGEKTKKYVIEDHPYTVMNNVADANVTGEDLKPQNGHIVLIDNDRDGRYEVVKVYAPQVIVIDSIAADQEAGEISISDADGNVTDIKADYLKITDAKGKSMAASRLKSGRLVYVYESSNSMAAWVEAMDSAFSGTITATSGEAIAVDGTSYEMTSYFEDNFYNQNALTLGKTASFYLDVNGRLVYMTGESVSKYSEVLAVVQRAIVVVDDDVNIFTIYDQNGQFRELKFAENVRVNGIKRTLFEIESMGRSFFEGKLVIVNILSDDSVNSVVTEDYTEGDIAKATVNLAGTRRGKAGFYNGHKLILPVVSDVPVFTLPIDTSTGRPHTDSKYTSYYNVVDYSKKWGVRTDISANNIGIYGLNEYNEPTALVDRAYYGTNSGTYGTITNYAASGAMMFDRYTVSSSGDDEIYYTIHGYDLTSGKSLKITLKNGLEKIVNTYKIRNYSWFSDVTSANQPGSDWLKDTKLVIKEKVTDDYLEDISYLEKGDIIRYDNANSASQLELVVENEVFDASKCGVVYNAGDSPSTILSTYRIQYAIAEEIKDGHIKFLYQTNIYETLDLENFDGKITVLENGTFQSYDMASAGVAISKGDRIAVYSNAGYHKSIVVYR